LPYPLSKRSFNKIDVDIKIYFIDLFLSYLVPCYTFQDCNIYSFISINTQENPNQIIVRFLRNMQGAVSISELKDMSCKELLNLMNSLYELNKKENERST